MGTVSTLSTLTRVCARMRARHKVEPDRGGASAFGLLTTDANTEVGAIHPKAMPVILTTPEEIETWMTAPAEDALKLQRPLPDGALRVVATGEKEDKAAWERKIMSVTYYVALPFVKTDEGPAAGQAQELPNETAAIWRAEDTRGMPARSRSSGAGNMGNFGDATVLKQFG